MRLEEGMEVRRWGANLSHDRPRLGGPQKDQKSPKLLPRMALQTEMEADCGRIHQIPSCRGHEEKKQVIRLFLYINRSSYTHDGRALTDNRKSSCVIMSTFLNSALTLTK